MSEQLITAGEAAQKLGVTTDIPVNKCITKAEFDELSKDSSIFLNPDSAPNGIYIMYKTGKLVVYQYIDKINKNEASGVAVKLDNLKVVLAKDTFKVRWGINWYIPDCFENTNKEQAMRDTNGIKNTDAIIKELDKKRINDYAAKICKEYTFLHNKTGYLPSLGELYLLHDYVDKIYRCMDLIKNTFKPYQFISSSQYDTREAWSFSFLQKDIQHYGKTENTFYQVLPFSTF